ncbi:hypothetical protein [Micromonospora craniellae]|uniref:Uncharacterized protein n=1 Tax=Micromonospora craniellae TaxID=2294034 RepID=A0A372G1H8_9ACTN|nr:hypothetical protein [Micromonospora craniellae]QOC92763.1 hypothetical protein ID554_03115 [Micromonospora craniellae]RFS46911.1 hypothetical protein D0Q02_09025 [Micromonospora craniellae]
MRAGHVEQVRRPVLGRQPPPSAPRRQPLVSGRRHPDVPEVGRDHHPRRLHRRRTVAIRQLGHDRRSLVDQLACAAAVAPPTGGQTRLDQQRRAQRRRVAGLLRDPLRGHDRGIHRGPSPPDRPQRLTQRYGRDGDQQRVPGPQGDGHPPVRRQPRRLPLVQLHQHQSNQPVRGDQQLVADRIGTVDPYLPDRVEQVR